MFTGENVEKILKICEMFWFSYLRLNYTLLNTPTLARVMDDNI